MSTTKYCSMCTYCTSSEYELVAHVCKIHRYHPNFLVYCSSCFRSYSKWNTYKKHLSRGCSLQVHQDSSVDSEGTHHLEPTTSDEFSASNSIEDGLLDCNSLATPSQDWHEAAYILYIKENHVITQNAINTILPHTNQLFSSLLDSVSRQLRANLSEEAMKFVEQAHSNVLPLFSSLSTPHLQRKFFRENFTFVVSGC